MKIEGREPAEILQNLIELKSTDAYFSLENPDDDPITDVPKIKDTAKSKLLTKHIRQLIRHPLFEQYNLSSQDALVIADLWQLHLDNPGRGAVWSSICFSAKLAKFKVAECLDYITSLIERQIICFDEKVSGNYYLNPLILQSGEYTLSGDFILRIMGRDLRADLDLCMQHEWKNDQDFLSDLHLLFDLCYDSFGELSRRSPVLEYPILKSCLDLLKDRILTAPDSLGIKTLALQHALSEIQLFIILIVLYHQLHREECIAEPDLILSLSPDSRERWLLQKQLETTALLLSEGILIKERPYHRSQICSIELSDELSIKLGCETNQDAKAPAKKISSFFEMANPPQKLADLIIPEDDKKLLSLIANKCHKGKSAELQKWGFNPDKTTSKKGLIVLLYGAPGTGKTFAAGAVANELKRDLIKLNVPELRNKYYGETEKLLKKAFGEMRLMAVQNSNPPIFLLNEADQLVHNRISSNSTCGAIENTIQSIILEEMETFPGILILTTNLESNMDEAFFRRFDLKMKFKLPDLECRRKLWKLYLKKEIPGARAIDIELLSQRYSFSGAQIALVVQNACVEAINRSGSEKRLALTDLSKYADLEKPWTKGLSKSIGF